MIKAFIGALAALVLVAVPAAAAPTFPPLSGRVVDGANILSPAAEQRITERLEGLETATGRQLVVATLADLQGHEIEEYGYRLGRAWAIGDAERDDGALLIVAPSERRVRIEVGYGLEPVLTDALSSSIIEARIIPHFRDGDMEAGVEAGVEAIAAQLSLPEGEALAAVERATSPAGEGPNVFGLIVGLMIFFFFVMPIIGAVLSAAGGRRGRRGSLGSALPWIILGALADHAGRGGGGRGGGWSGGGGFSGGGGSFGGGGASGRW